MSQLRVRWTAKRSVEGWKPSIDLAAVSWSAGAIYARVRSVKDESETVGGEQRWHSNSLFRFMVGTCMYLITRLLQDVEVSSPSLLLSTFLFLP